MDRFRRMFALRGSDPVDPRVDALAADMREVLQVAVAQQAANGRGDSSALSQVSAQDLQRWVAGLEAALHALAPAVARVWELCVLGPSGNWELLADVLTEGSETK